MHLKQKTTFLHLDFTFICFIDARKQNNNCVAMNLKSFGSS